MNNYKLLLNSKTDMIGRFTIYINNDKNEIYKKIKNNKLGKRLKKKLQNKKEFSIYKHILLNTINNPVFGIHTLLCYDIEKDGSYKCKYKKGYRLDKLLTEEGTALTEGDGSRKLTTLNNEYKDIDKNKIKNQIMKLQNILSNNFKNISGDWALHNLIYSIDDDKIYNVDMEGFYTNKRLPEWGNIEKINMWFNNIINKLNE